MRFSKSTFILPLIIFSIFLVVDNTLADEQHSLGSEGVSLGTVDFPISCRPEVQNQFNRGVALLHHMMYSDSEKVFVGVAETDPDCAMAHWGIAMTQFHPLWAPPGREDLRTGSAAVKKAISLKPSTTREQGYVAAVAAFYKNWKRTDHPTRIAAWEKIQEQVHKKYPEDVNAGAFFALSHLATGPKGDKTFAHQKKAGELLEKLHATAPKHPGLFHYIIHAYDNPILASRAVKVAQGYLKLAPDVPHALHMPSHIFVRLGLWSDVIDWNLRSSAAAQKQSVGQPASLHYIHAMDYLMYAYLQQGQDKKAEEVLSEINRTENYQDSFASAYGIAAAQARYPLERRQWADAATLPVRTHSAFPWGKYPWHESIIYFARGLGAPQSGDLSTVAKSIGMLDLFYDRAIQAGEIYWAVLVDSQRKTVAAWKAHSKGKKDQAMKMMREAADIEDSVDKHPVTPGAVLPARELLGDMLLQMDKHGEALKAYEASLLISPNRLNSLYGAGQAAEHAGDIDKARFYYSKLVQLRAGIETDRPSVQHAKAFLTKN